MNATTSTSRLAGEAAEKLVGSRQARIIQLLRDRGPLTIFEVAAELGVFDHQISGRFSELERQGMIRKTGQRRRKPDTRCDAEVYDLGDVPAALPPDPGSALGFPDTITVDGEPFDRESPLGMIDAPGVPYARRSTLPGMRLSYRVEFLECGGCGRLLRMFEEDAGGGLAADGSAVKRKRRTFRCGTEGCGRSWELLIVSEPGKLPLPALVMKHL